MGLLYTRSRSYYEKLEPEPQPVQEIKIEEKPDKSILGGLWKTFLNRTSPLTSVQILGQTAFKKGIDVVKEPFRPIIIDKNLQWQFAKRGEEGINKLRQVKTDIEKLTGKEVIIDPLINAPKGLSEELPQEILDRESGFAIKGMTKKRLVEEDRTHEMFSMGSWQKKPENYYEGLITPAELDKTKNEIRQKRLPVIEERKKILSGELERQKQEILAEYTEQNKPEIEKLRTYLDEQISNTLNVNDLTTEDILNVYHFNPDRATRFSVSGPNYGEIFLQKAKEGFFGGLLESEIQPESTGEEVAGVLGNVAGFMGSLWLIGGTLKFGALATTKGAAFYQKYPYLANLINSTASFNIQGQIGHGLDLDIKNRLNSVFWNTTMSLGFAGTGMFGKYAGFPIQGAVGFGLVKLNGGSNTEAITTALAFMALHGSDFIKPVDGINILKREARGKIKFYTEQILGKDRGIKLPNYYKKSDLEVIRNIARTTKEPYKTILEESANFLNKIPDRNKVFIDWNPLNNVKKNIRLIKEEMRALIGIDKKIELEPATMNEQLKRTEPQRPKLDEKGISIVLGSLKTQPLTQSVIDFLKSSRGQDAYYKRLNTLKELFNKVKPWDQKRVGEQIDALVSLGRQLGYEGERITDIKPIIRTEQEVISTIIENLKQGFKQKVDVIKSPEEYSRLISEAVKKEFPDITDERLKQVKSIIGSMLKGKSYEMAKLSTEKILIKPEEFAKLEEFFVSPIREKSKEIGFTKIKELKEKNKYKEVSKISNDIINYLRKEFFPEEKISTDKNVGTYFGGTEGGIRTKDGPIARFLNLIFAKHNNQDSILNRNFKGNEHPNLVLKFKKLSIQDGIKISNLIEKISKGQFGGSSHLIDENSLLVSYVPEFAKKLSTDESIDIFKDIVIKLKKRGYNFKEDIRSDSTNGLILNKNYEKEINTLKQENKRIQRLVEESRDPSFVERTEKNLRDRFGIVRTDKFWEAIREGTVLDIIKNKEYRVGITTSTTKDIKPEIKEKIERARNLQKEGNFKQANKLFDEVLDIGEKRLKELFKDLDGVKIEIQRTQGNFFKMGEPIFDTKIVVSDKHFGEVEKRLVGIGQEWAQDNIHISRILVKLPKDVRVAIETKKGILYEPNIDFRFNRPLTDREYYILSKEILRDPKINLPGSTLHSDKQGINLYDIGKEGKKSYEEFITKTKRLAKSLRDVGGRIGKYPEDFRGFSTSGRTRSYRELRNYGNKEYGATRTYEDIRGEIRVEPITGRGKPVEVPLIKGLEKEIANLKAKVGGFDFKWGVGEESNRLIQTETREGLRERIEKLIPKTLSRDLQTKQLQDRMKMEGKLTILSREYTPEEMRVISQELGIEMSPLDQIKAIIKETPVIEKEIKKVETLPGEIKISDLSLEERKILKKEFGLEKDDTIPIEEYEIFKKEFLPATETAKQEKIAVKEISKRVKEKIATLPQETVEQKAVAKQVKTTVKEIVSDIKQEIKQKPYEALEVSKTEGLAESRAYKNWLNVLNNLSPDIPLYERKNIAEERAKAQIFADQNPELAKDIVLGNKTVPKDITLTSLEDIMINRAEFNKDAKFLNELTSRHSLRLTAEGQDIAMQRGTYDPDSAAMLIKELKKQKRNKLLKVNYIEDPQKIQEAYKKIIQEPAKKINKEITLKAAKIKMAEDILRSIIC